MLNFTNAIGSKPGKLFPSGNPIDVIDCIAVTCIDVVMPMVIGRAQDFGVTGYASREELDAIPELFEAIERIRIPAGKLMGFGEVSNSVVPGFGLLAPPREHGSVSARYFMPWSAHPTYAVTGSICTGTCLLSPGTVAEGVAETGNDNPVTIRLEHPSGMIDVVFDYSPGNDDFELNSAGFLRTARRLFTGTVSIPSG